MRGSRVAISEDRHLAEHLRAHIRAHAGVESAVVLRPLVGVALQLPVWASPAAVAWAIDAEQVTAGFLDFAGRCCVAVPAPYINRLADECPDPPALPVLDNATLLETACALLDTASALTTHLHALRGQLLPPDIQQVIGEALELVGSEVNATCEGLGVHQE